MNHVLEYRKISNNHSSASKIIFFNQRTYSSTGKQLVLQRKATMKLTLRELIVRKVKKFHTKFFYRLEYYMI